MGFLILAYIHAYVPESVCGDATREACSVPFPYTSFSQTLSCAHLASRRGLNSHDGRPILGWAARPRGQ